VVLAWMLLFVVLVLVELHHLAFYSLFVAIGCQGRGIAWQTAMGGELAKLALDPHYDPVLPFSPVRPIPFHPLKALGVASTIALWRALDLCRLS